VTGESKAGRVTKADKGQFDELLRRMIRTNPKKTSEIKKKRRKNPETDPAHLPVFDFSKKIRIVKPEETEPPIPPTEKKD
jgi:hypothetical protein